MDVLEAHVQRLADDALVVGLKPHAFRRKFDAILAGLGLESLGLTPASLRAGGATERHLQREPIADISWLLRHGTSRRLATTSSQRQQCSRLRVFRRSRPPPLKRMRAALGGLCATFASHRRPLSSL